jgi:hypothetical protein
MDSSFNDELTSIYELPKELLFQDALEASNYEVVESMLANGYTPDHNDFISNPLIKVILNFDLPMIKLLDNYGILSNLSFSDIKAALYDTLQAKRDLNLINLVTFEKNLQKLDNLKVSVNK